MIRPATPDDRTGILDVALASGLFEENELEALTGMLDEHFGSAETVGQWLADVHDNGTVAGVAYIEPERMTEGTYNLLFIAVHPNHQKQGRGAKILVHVEELLRAQAGRVLLIETMGVDDFEYVRAFYGNRGFESEARIRDYYAAGADKIVFWKTL